MIIVEVVAVAEEVRREVETATTVDKERDVECREWEAVLEVVMDTVEIPWDMVEVPGIRAMEEDISRITEEVRIRLRATEAVTTSSLVREELRMTTTVVNGSGAEEEEGLINSTRRQMAPLKDQLAADAFSNGIDSFVLQSIGVFYRW